MKKLFSLAILGLGARWFFDAQRGAERRAMIAERARRLGGSERVQDAATGIRGAAGGVGASVRDTAGSLRDSAGDVRDTVVARAADTMPGGGATEDPATLAGNPDDARLHDRVETELFRGSDVPKGDVNVNVEFGKVVLRGEVESRELIDDLDVRVRAIEGVSDVENLLHTPGEPAPMHE